MQSTAAQHKRFQWSFELSEGDVWLPKLFRQIVPQRWQNSGHRTGCVISWPIPRICTVIPVRYQDHNYLTQSWCRPSPNTLTEGLTGVKWPHHGVVKGLHMVVKGLICRCKGRVTWKGLGKWASKTKLGQWGLKKGRQKMRKKSCPDMPLQK